MADTGKFNIGWIGVGAMGLPMARNLLAAGHAVSAFDTRPERTALLAEHGGRSAASVADACRGADVVVSMVYDDAALDALAAGPTGLLAGIAPGTVYMDMSTVSPAASSRLAAALAQQGIAYLRAPVSGTTVLAESAQLSIFASGPEAAFQQCLPLFQALSARQRYVGEGEAARVLKLVINLMVVASTALIGEALNLGEKAGLARGLLVDAINDSIVGSAHYKVRGESLKSRQYNRNGPLSLVAKDMDMALQLAAECHTVLPLGAHIRSDIEQLLGQGLGEYEVTVLTDAYRT